MAEKRQIAAFDFDGTITNKDTFVEFITFAFGKRKMLVGFFLFAPYIIAMKVGIYPNWKAKQKVFSWFFKGMKHDVFSELGQSFAEKIVSMTNNKTLSLISRCQEDGSEVCVVTASIEEWVRPYCETIGIDKVIATTIEVDESGCLTGCFSSKNCYGKEKVVRLLEIEPNREEYFLFACGDSRGDKELMEFADERMIIR